jgi:putative transposase
LGYDKPIFEKEQVNMGQTSESERKSLIHMIRSGKKPEEATQELSRGRSWAYKWWRRYCIEDWAGLQERSRAPKRHPSQIATSVRQAICRIRSELEAEAYLPDKLSYIGAASIRSRMKREGIRSVPSISTIEQVLRDAGMTKPRIPKAEQKVVYPQLSPRTSHQLVQVDIVPHYLSGGALMACFNGIDTVSRFPDGQQYDNKSTDSALDFLVHLWLAGGIPHYTQVDNESSFCGGRTHPGVIGRVARLALLVGTELVFSPYYSPECNGFVERFHQDYSANVWEKVTMRNLDEVRKVSAAFFPRYRTSEHHSELHGQSPASIHCAAPVRRLPANFKILAHLPITEGKIHFMRVVGKAGNILVTNQQWDAGLAQPNQGVWATLHIRQNGAKLRIYDAAPDALKRHCLAEHPFPLKEPVVPLKPEFQPDPNKTNWLQALLRLFRSPVRVESTMS